MLVVKRIVQNVKAIDRWLPIAYALQIIMKIYTLRTVLNVVFNVKIVLIKSFVLIVRD